MIDFFRFARFICLVGLAFKVLSVLIFDNRPFSFALTTDSFDIKFLLYRNINQVEMNGYILIDSLEFFKFIFIISRIARSIGGCSISFHVVRCFILIL